MGNCFFLSLFCEIFIQSIVVLSYVDYIVCQVSICVRVIIALQVTFFHSSLMPFLKVHNLCKMCDKKVCSPGEACIAQQDASVCSVKDIALSSFSV